MFFLRVETEKFFFGAETMSETEGEWTDLLHESSLESATAQVSSKPVSVPEPTVTLSHQTWYATSPRKGNTLATMTHVFGPAIGESVNR